MEVIGVKWFTAGVDTIGIVLTRDEFGEHKAYIGVGTGYNEDEDASHIAARGTSFSDGPLLWPAVESWRL